MANNGGVIIFGLEKGEHLQQQQRYNKKDKYILKDGNAKIFIP